MTGGVEKQFNLTVEIRQLEEAVLSVFHTIFLHRTSGKFHFTSEHTYSVGTLGFLDVPCETINFTYVKLASAELDKNISKQVRQFCDALLESADNGSAIGEVSIEFYQKRKSRWLFVSDSVPWETWSVRVETFRATSESEVEQARATLSDSLVDVVFEIADLVNSANRHVPQTPTQNELETVFDTAFADVQPFVFRMRFVTGSSNVHQSVSVGNTVKKLIQDTLLA